MAVRLLPKSLIAEQKAKVQTREIQEGMKLANRVDGLRELYSKTEQELETYRTATLASIGKEITELEGKKTKLEIDFRNLKSQYESMLSEIPTKRTELSEFEKSLTSWEKKLAGREERAELLEIDVAEALVKAKDSKLRTEDNERITTNLLIQANQTKQEAEQTLLTARKVEERAYSDKKDFEAAAILREYSITSKEKELLIMETDLMKQKKALEKEKIRLQDQRETLQRSLERIKHNRL